MKLIVDIPKDFERHYNNDKFEDSLKRINTDVTDLLKEDESISGYGELELLDMLVTAFKKSKVIHSVTNYDDLSLMNCDDIWNEAYDKRDGVK